MTGPSTSGAGTTGGPPVTRTQRLSSAVGACLAQVLVIIVTAMMGLGWSGATYTAATTQSLLALAVIVIIAAFARRPRSALIVPLLSAALTAVLLMAGSQVGDLGA